MTKFVSVDKMLYVREDMKDISFPPPDVLIEKHDVKSNQAWAEVEGEEIWWPSRQECLQCTGCVAGKPRIRFPVSAAAADCSHLTLWYRLIETEAGT